PDDGTGVRTSLRLRWSPTFSSRLPNTVLKLLLMLGDRFPATNSQPCFGCGAFRTRSRAQFSVHSVADCPSRFQNWGVAYIAWTRCPAPPASVSSVLGRLTIATVDSCGAQMRTPPAALRKLPCCIAAKPPVRGPV